MSDERLYGGIVYQDYAQVVGGPPRVRAFKFVKNSRGPGYLDYWTMVADETGATVDEAYASAEEKATNAKRRPG